MSAWQQSEIILPEFPRGCHLITQHVIHDLAALKRCRTGLMHVFIQHTSASLTINENADPDVPDDLGMALDRLALNLGRTGIPAKDRTTCRPT